MVVAMNKPMSFRRLREDHNKFEFFNENENIKVQGRIDIMKLIINNSIFLTLLFYILIYAQTDDIWQATNGPETGTVNSFARNSSGQIFAGTDQGFIYRWNDDDASWHILNSLGAPKYIDVIMIPDGITIYASS